MKSFVESAKAAEDLWLSTYSSLFLMPYGDVLEPEFIPEAVVTRMDHQAGDTWYVNISGGLPAARRLYSLPTSFNMDVVNKSYGLDEEYDPEHIIAKLRGCYVLSKSIQNLILGSIEDRDSVIELSLVLECVVEMGL